MNIQKRGVKLPFTLELIVNNRRHGHAEPRPVTSEDRSAHKRAKKALKELERNPWVEWPRMDDDITIRPLEKHEWVWDETEDEWRERISA